MGSLSADRRTRWRLATLDFFAGKLSFLRPGVRPASCIITAQEAARPSASGCPVIDQFEIAALASRLAEPGEVYPSADGIKLVSHVADLALDRRFPRGRAVIDSLDGNIILRPTIESLEAKLALIATTRTPLVSAGWRFGFRRMRQGWRFCDGLIMMRVRETNDPEAAEAFVLTVARRSPSVLFWRRRARTREMRPFWQAKDGRVFEAFKYPV
jgi:hypothetical protein